MEIRIVIDGKQWGESCRRMFSSRKFRLGALLAMGLAPVLVYAATYNKPNSFTDGQAISAAQVNANFDTLYNAVNELDGRPGKHIIWSGGCNSHGTAGGANTYCNNSVDFNTAGDYLTAVGNGTFTVKKAGYYRVSYWGIALGNNYCYVLLYKNGSYVAHQHNYCGNEGAWKDNFLDQTWPFNAGDSFYVVAYNPGTYAYHSWNSNGAHSRIQVSYAGTL